MTAKKARVDIDIKKISFYEKLNGSDDVLIRIMDYSPCKTIHQATLKALIEKSIEENVHIQTTRYHHSTFGALIKEGSKKLITEALSHSNCDYYREKLAERCNENSTPFTSKEMVELYLESNSLEHLIDWLNSINAIATFDKIKEQFVFVKVTDNIFVCAERGEKFNSGDFNNSFYIGRVYTYDEGAVEIPLNEENSFERLISLTDSFDNIEVKTRILEINNENPIINNNNILYIPYCSMSSTKICLGLNETSNSRIGLVKKYINTKYDPEAFAKEHHDKTFLFIKTHNKHDKLLSNTHIPTKTLMCTGDLASLMVTSKLTQISEDGDLVIVTVDKNTQTDEVLNMIMAQEKQTYIVGMETEF